jgi:predicted nucleic acid-binding protein
MNGDRFVVDASVAIKWVIGEAGSEQALLIRNRQRLFAPDLLLAECANILWKKARRKELSEAEAIFGARLLLRAGVQLQAMSSLLEPATRLALFLDHPAYDCAYLALSQMLSCTMVTADQRLYRKALSSGFKPQPLYLAEFPG